MLDFFKQLSLKRSAWIFLAFTAFALESTALYFQYGMGLQPCVLCVYERLAMVGSFIAGFINHEDFFVLKISFGFILLICGLGLWILELLLHDSQYLNYYCAFFAGLQNGFLTHNRLKLRASHVSGCFTDAGVYFGRLCRNHKEYLVKFILNVINIIIFFLGVLLGGYLFLHVREHVYMILSLLYVGLCIYYFVISFLFFHKPIDLEVT